MQTVLYEFMTQRDGTVRRLRSAAATLIVIASKQRKWQEEKIGLFLTKARIVKSPGKTIARCNPTSYPKIARF